MAIPGYKIIGPDGRETQPFDSDALVSYARQGYIQPQTMVFDPGLGRWLSAAQVPVLQALGGAPSAPPPQPSPGYAAPYPYAPPQGSVPGAPYPTTPGYPNAAPNAYAGSASRPRPVSRGFVIGIAVVVGIVVALCGVGIKYVATLSGQNQTINTADGRYGMSIPALWIHWRTHDPNIVEYMDTSSGAGITLVQITHSAPQPGDLDRITENCSSLVAEQLKSPGQIGQTQTVKIAGYDARQVEMNDNGVVGLHFRLTVISAPSGIYQVSDFQKVANVDEERPKMDQLLSTFHATGQ